MGAIFRVNQNDLPWFEYADAGTDDGGARVRVKGLTVHAEDVPPVQYVEYAPDHADPVHSHDTDEFFLVIEGELWLEGVASGPGSVLFIPRGTEYSVRGGNHGARYFRVVVP